MGRKEGQRHTHTHTIKKNKTKQVEQIENKVAR